MNRVFVDTSALIALSIAKDENHQTARRIFEALAVQEAPLLTTSYGLVETYALLGRRVGIEAVQDFRGFLAPLIEIIWVDRALHEAGIELLINRRLRRLSLVDAVGFVTIRQHGIRYVFAFDRHFSAEGFKLLR